jgi:HEAT repeat protein
MYLTEIRKKVGFRVFMLLVVGLATVGCVQDTNDRIGSIYEAKADPTEENILKIRESLDDPEGGVRATAINALVGIGVPDSAKIALEGLEDEDGFVRRISAKLLGDVGDPANVEILVKLMLEDDDPAVRQASAESLEKLGGDAAVEGLIAGLEDPMKGVRLAAARGIRSVDPAAAIPEMARLALEDPIWEIRVQAARALGTTGDPAVLPVLEKALEDEDKNVSAAAANALAVHEAVTAMDRGALE